MPPATHCKRLFGHDGGHASEPEERIRLPLEIRESGMGLKTYMIMHLRTDRGEAADWYTYAECYSEGTAKEIVRALTAAAERGAARELWPESGKASPLELRVAQVREQVKKWRAAGEEHKAQACEAIVCALIDGAMLAREEAAEELAQRMERTAESHRLLAKDCNESGLCLAASKHEGAAAAYEDCASTVRGLRGTR